MPNAITEIGIFPIASTVVDKEQVRAWLDFVGAEEFVLPWEEDKIRKELEPPEQISDPATLVALAAKGCYMSFDLSLNPNLTAIRRDLTATLDNVLEKGHGSVLEHSVYSFAIANCTRVFTAEMNRHRAGWAISERSLRYVRFQDEIPYWLPYSIREDPNDSPEIAERKRISREIFRRSFANQEKDQAELVEAWNLEENSKDFHYKKLATSCFRRIIGMGVCTGGIWTGNLRALRHVIALRATGAAEEEIFHIATRMLTIMIEREPTVFQDFDVLEYGGVTVKYPKV